MTALVAHRDTVAGFVIAVPDGWRCSVHGRYVPLVAVEPATRYDTFRANVVVNVAPVPAGLDLARLHAAATTAMYAQLPEFFLIDEDVRGDVAYRLAQHRVDDADGRTYGGVTMAQWTRLAGTRGVTVTASAATLLYPMRAALFAAIADTFSTSTGGPDDV